MPIGIETPVHVVITIESITSCIKSLNNRLEAMTSEERDSICPKALDLHQESRYTLALTHGIVDTLAPIQNEMIPFA